MIEECIICSDCFRRHGLKLMAERFGIKDGGQCPHCGSRVGARLTREKARELANDYIVKGSFYRTTFGGSPVYMLSDTGHDDILFEHDPDLVFLLEKCGLSAFQNAPATWRVGITSWLKELQSKCGSTRKRVVERLIGGCDITECESGTVFYRLLTRMYGDCLDPLSYDSPHWRHQKKGRFGLHGTSVLYLSSSIESAIHECRVTVEDNLYLASVSIKEPLRILDLTTTLNDSGDPWEDLSLSLSFICSTGEEAYPITRRIASAAFEQGYDGIYYWSFFNQVSPEKGKNLVLFGSPIKEGKVEVVSKDRLLLDQIKYSFSLGANI